MFNLVRNSYSFLSFFKDRLAVFKISSSPQIQSKYQRIQSLKSQLTLLMVSISIGMLTLDFGFKSIKNRLWDESQIPLELIEEVLLSRGFQRQKISAPITGIPEIRMDEVWIHDSHAWIIAFGEIFISPKNSPESEIPQSGWAQYASNLRLFETLTTLIPGRVVVQKKQMTRSSRYKKRPLDPREFTF